MKARIRENQMSSVEKLWTEDDFHCMKMNMFCYDIAKSLGEDARMATMRKFCNWNEKWHHPSGGLSPWGDDILHKRLKNKFLDIKLIYQDKLFWIHNVVLMKKWETTNTSLLPSTKFLSECCYDCTVSSTITSN